MLYDTVLQDGADFCSVFPFDWEMLKDELVDAVKFQVSDDVTYAIDNVLDSKPSSIINAFPVCKLPHKRMWIEFSPKYRADIREGRGSVVDKIVKKELGESHEPPGKMGAIINAKDDSMQRGTMTFAWLHKKDGMEFLTISPMQIHFNWTKEEEEDIDIFRNLYSFSDDLEEWRKKLDRVEPDILDGSKTAKFSKSDDELRAMLQMHKSSSMVLHPYAKSAIMSSAIRLGKEGFTRLILNCRYDVEGEANFILGALLLINSKNSISLEEQTFDKLNKKRVKTGKAPLHSYYDVQISLTKGQQNRLQSNGVAGPKMRMHLCRGHFKVRKTGVFWWMPHTRGDVKLGKVNKTYTLTG